MGRTKESVLREVIQKDLVDQLERNGTSGQYYIDLIRDYMEMWDTKNKLAADIKKRGITVENTTTAGVNLKKNDSVTDLVKINAQMLKLLSEIGIKPARTSGEGDEEM